MLISSEVFQKMVRDNECNNRDRQQIASHLLTMLIHDACMLAEVHDAFYYHHEKGFPKGAQLQSESLSVAGIILADLARLLDLYGLTLDQAMANYVGRTETVPPQDVKKS